MVEQPPQGSRCFSSPLSLEPHSAHVSSCELSAFFFSITSEVILFGFFWGATIINKVLAVTFYLLGV